MTAKICPWCGSGAFLLCEDSGVMFVTCASLDCNWKCRIEVIAETMKKGGE